MMAEQSCSGIYRLRVIRGMGGVIALGAIGFLAVAAQATELELGKHIEKLKISGDFRLRQETFDFKDAKAGRGRQRYRVRHP